MMRKRYKDWGLRLVAPKEWLIALLILSFPITASFADPYKTFDQKIGPLKKIRESLTFAVIGDTRPGGEEYQSLTHLMMGYHPAFVVNTGDMIRATNKTQWTQFWEESKSVTVPYFLTAGNHDAYDADSEKLFREETALPGKKLYYSFHAGDSLFVILDSNIPGRDREITDGQYHWLERTLSSHYRHKFIFVHHPLYPEEGRGQHYGESLDLFPKERDRLERLFERNKVTIVFTGHEHLYLRRTIGDVMHVITGGGGAELYAEDDKGGFHHFILIKVEGNRVSGQVIDSRGIVRDSFLL